MQCLRKTCQFWCTLRSNIISNLSPTEQSEDLCQTFASRHDGGPIEGPPQSTRYRKAVIFWGAF